MGVAVGEEHSNAAAGAERHIAAVLPWADSMPAVAAELRQKNGGSRGAEDVGGVGVGACWHALCMEVAEAFEVEALAGHDGEFEGCVEA